MWQQGIHQEMNDAERIGTLYIPNMGDGHVFIFAQIKHLNLHLEHELLSSLTEINPQKTINLIIPDYH